MDKENGVMTIVQAFPGAPSPNGVKVTLRKYFTFGFE